MKRKLPPIFLLIIAMSTVLILLLSALGWLTLGEFGTTTASPENFSRHFVDHIGHFEQNGTISETAKLLLREEGAWLQILDENGSELFSFDRPSEALTHYTPAVVARLQSGSDEIGGYTVFVGGTPNFSYLIGFPGSVVSKHLVIFNIPLILAFFMVVILISLGVFSVAALIFGKNITDPIIQIIEGLQLLGADNYWLRYEEKGVFANVFRSLNKLGVSLRLGVEEKMKTEQMREEWIANISHDLKTPLSSIKGYSEILADEDYSFSKAEMSQYARIILDKTVYLAELIEDLRLNQQLQGKSLPMLRETRNLTLFMSQLIIEILNHPNYSNRSLTFEASNDIILFDFDERLLKRSLVNLVMNALIHNPSETEIKISLEEEEGIRLIIEDTGRGMSETDLEKLFNRYYRGTNTTDFQGSGLGMAIAKEVIEAHQGTLEVESQVNQGTKITITFS